MLSRNLNIDRLIQIEDFISMHSNGNYFQSSQLYNFYKSFPNYEPIIIINTNTFDNINGSLLAVIHKEKGYLKGKLSSRCIVIGGPVVTGNNKEVTDHLLEELIKKVGSKSIYIEFRNLFD